MIPTTPIDGAGGDANLEPGATVKSLIKSFDTVGQSEHRASQHTDTHTHTHTHWEGILLQQCDCRGQQLVRYPVWISVISPQQSYVQLCGTVWSELTPGTLDVLFVFFPLCLSVDSLATRAKLMCWIKLWLMRRHVPFLIVLVTATLWKIVCSCHVLRKTVSATPASIIMQFFVKTSTVPWQNCRACFNTSASKIE